MNIQIAALLQADLRASSRSTLGDRGTEKACSKRRIVSTVGTARRAVRRALFLAARSATTPYQRFPRGGGWGKRGCVNSQLRLYSSRTKPATAFHEPDGLENSHVEFHGGRLRRRRAKRQDGRKQAATNASAQRRRPFARDKVPCIRGILCVGRGKWSSVNAKDEKLTDRLAGQE